MLIIAETRSGRRLCFIDIVPYTKCAILVSQALGQDYRSKGAVTQPHLCGCAESVGAGLSPGMYHSWNW